MGGDGDCQPVLEIRGHPDAWYEWEERIGIFQANGVVPTPAMLAMLRNKILKRWELADAYRVRMGKK